MFNRNSSPLIYDRGPHPAPNCKNVRKKLLYIFVQNNHVSVKKDKTKCFLVPAGKSDLKISATEDEKVVIVAMLKNPRRWKNT